MTPDMPVRLFGEDLEARLEGHVIVGGMLPPLSDLADDHPLSRAELLIACWGAPRLDAELLELMPRLRAVVYAAGSVRGIMTSEAYARGIRISSAAAVNALPVAEFTVGSVLLSGKRIFAIDAEYRQTHDYRPPSTAHPRWGNFGLRVGIVSASRIGRRVIELLRPYDMDVRVWDPTATEPIEGATLMPLDELLATSDVVSVHAPELPETRHLIGRRELGMMAEGATLINTARGSVVDQEALVDVLHTRRIRAIIDVTEPDPLPAGHPLFDAPNLVLTPHIAGSQGTELRRLGNAAISEAIRFAREESFVHDVPELVFAKLA